MAAPTVVGSGTVTADGTEQILYSTVTGAHYTATIDKFNLQNGDVIEVRYYKKVLTGSSFRCIDKLTYSNVQDVDDLLCYIPHISSPFGYKITLKQTSGTSRNFEWSVETP